MDARILIVDDNVDSVAGLARLLRRLGCEVETAHDGPSALEAAAARRPAFVLLDIGLPGMDGYQVAERLRAQLDERVVICAISGYGREKDLRRGKDAGFDHHLVKPVDVDELMTLLVGTGGPTDDASREAGEMGSASPVAGVREPRDARTPRARVDTDRTSPSGG